MTVTTDGLLAITRGLLQNVVVEDIDVISGWLIGELYFKVKEIQGNSVLIEFGIQDPKTKRIWDIQTEVWVPIGGTVRAENYSDQAFYVAQHVRHSPEKK